VKPVIERPMDVAQVAGEPTRTPTAYPTAYPTAVSGWA
jgi:hypothetical protein